MRSMPDIEDCGPQGDDAATTEVEEMSLPVELVEWPSSVWPVKLIEHPCSREIGVFIMAYFASASCAGRPSGGSGVGCAGLATQPTRQKPRRALSRREKWVEQCCVKFPHGLRSVDIPQDRASTHDLGGAIRAILPSLGPFVRFEGADPVRARSK
jgi:hypothetical protein